MVRFSIEEPDGVQGSPGVLSSSVTYGLTEENAVEIHYTGALTAGVAHTVFNPTDHAYPNPAGHDAGEIDAQEVWIHADYFTPTDAVPIPTGELQKVAGTVFDLRQMKPVGRDIEAEEGQLLLGHEYDHNFVVKGYGGLVRLIVEACDPASGRTFAVYADRPGFQFYTTNQFSEGVPIDKEGAVYRKRGGHCFETQCFPDASYHLDWIQPVIPTGATVWATSIHRPGDSTEEGGRN